MYKYQNYFRRFVKTLLFMAKNELQDISDNWCFRVNKRRKADFEKTIDKLNKERSKAGASLVMNSRLAKRLMAAIINDPKGTLKAIKYDEID